MTSYLLFGLYLLITLIFKGISRILFGSRRYRRHLFYRFREIMLDLQARHGGSVSAARRSRFEYVLPDGSARVQVTSHSRAVLKIFVPQQLTGTAVFYKLPRLIAAFAESFVADPLKIPGASFFGVASNPQDVAVWKRNSGFENLMSFFFSKGYSIRMDHRGLSAWKNLTQSDLSEIDLFENVRKLRILAGLCAARLVSIPVQEVESESHCAYCKEALQNTEEMVRCSSCGTPHHRECFDLNGRCTVFGCSSTRPVEAEAVTFRQ